MHSYRWINNVICRKRRSFVRYHAAQFAIFNVIFVLAMIPVIGWMLTPIVGFLAFVAFIMALIKINGGERFDIPFLSDWGLKLMSAID